MEILGLECGQMRSVKVFLCVSWQAGVGGGVAVARSYRGDEGPGCSWGEGGGARGHYRVDFCCWNVALSLFSPPSLSLCALVLIFARLFNSSSPSGQTSSLEPNCRISLGEQHGPYFLPCLE